MNKLFSPEPLWQKQGMLLLRVATGLLMAYHGLEVFKPETIKGYAQWDVIKKLPAPLLMAYLGKGLELVTGVLLTIGLCTRVAALFMAINMFFICFKIGNGKFYYEDQHPFIFGLLALVFFFSGPGIAAADNFLFKKK
jgi:putative oxidoreductase